MNDAAASPVGIYAGYVRRAVHGTFADIAGRSRGRRRVPPRGAADRARLARWHDHGAVMVLHHPDRVVWVHVSAAPIRMPDGRRLGAVTTFSDITALHDLQEQQFLLLHLVSHDLRTPLSVVSGYTSVIADKIAELGVDGALPRV